MKYAIIFEIDWYSPDGEALARSLDVTIWMRNEYVKMFGTKRHLLEYENRWSKGFKHYVVLKVITKTAT